MENDPLAVDLQQAKRDIANENKDLPTRVDPTGRTVHVKSANKPFFVYQDYKREQERLASEKAARKKARDEKIARGEDPGRDPDAPWVTLPSAGKILQTLLLLIVMTAYAGHFIVGDWRWGNESKWLTLRHYQNMIPDGVQMAYTEQQLAKYDGSDPDPLKPVLLAFDGIVYDVTKGRRIYGPGGGYHQFAGKDAARAYVTGCFKIHLTHDLRGLTSERNLKSIEKWRTFYANHKDYKRVGTVYHPPIHPDTPLPPPCDKHGNAILPEGEEKKDVPPIVGPTQRQEL